MTRTNVQIREPIDDRLDEIAMRLRAFDLSTVDTIRVVGGCRIEELHVKDVLRVRREVLRDPDLVIDHNSILFDVSTTKSRIHVAVVELLKSLRRARDVSPKECRLIDLVLDRHHVTSELANLTKFLLLVDRGLDLSDRLERGHLDVDQSESVGPGDQRHSVEHEVLGFHLLLVAAVDVAVDFTSHPVEVSSELVGVHGHLVRFRNVRVEHLFSLGLWICSIKIERIRETLFSKHVQLFTDIWIDSACSVDSIERTFERFRKVGLPVDVLPHLDPVEVFRPFVFPCDHLVVHRVRKLQRKKTDLVTVGDWFDVCFSLFVLVDQTIVNDCCLCVDVSASVVSSMRLFIDLRSQVTDGHVACNLVDRCIVELGLDLHHVLDRTFSVTVEEHLEELLHLVSEETRSRLLLRLQTNDLQLRLFEPYAFHVGECESVHLLLDEHTTAEHSFSVCIEPVRIVCIENFACLLVRDRHDFLHRSISEFAKPLDRLCFTHVRAVLLDDFLEREVARVCVRRDPVLTRSVVLLKKSLERLAEIPNHELTGDGD
ncbi:hypothetical protein AU106_gp226 [Sinorhizobium phage phiM9]|uniref:Uncharacterized protein n=1 Tax=Sinorhizobium phage phiM9 TaxID=1636182 RepID=A0A0F6R550_9CAUD|nr:hypothetical protein AU106_gp226 [Sinorhizobium phage phiM9]AKE44857.1 hypothetical protein Sm_phiM9_230 [Sinorhizobium phage phiM9]